MPVTALKAATGVLLLLFPVHDLEKVCNFSIETPRMMYGSSEAFLLAEMLLFPALDAKTADAPILDNVCRLGQYSIHGFKAVDATTTLLSGQSSAIFILYLERMLHIEDRFLPFDFLL